ncbi:MAG: TonB-dependent receptor [Alcanivorax sp.]|nr:TonB-dependent receptor [Alcanivorax sp.]
MTVLLSAAQAAELPPVQVIASEGRDTSLPTSATTVSAGSLEHGGLVSAADLPSAAVSLQLTQPDNRNTGIFIRGLGTTGFNDGMQGSVGVTVDDVALGRQAMFPAHLYDIEAVDVVRTPVLGGPGPVTSVGALHIRHRAPDWHNHTALKASRGSDGLRHHELVANGELVPGVLAGRISAYNHRRDGVVDNLTTGRKVNNAQHDAVRAQLLWLPGGDSRARLILERTHLDENCCAYSVAHYSQASQNRAALLGHPLLAADPFSREVAQDSDNRRLMDQDSATLHLDTWLTPGMRLVSVSGYREWDMHAWQDLDGIDLAIAPRGGSELQHRQWSQALSLEGSLGSAVDYQLGGYYHDHAHRRSRSLTYGPDAARWFTAGLGFPPVDEALLASVMDGATVVSPGTESARHRALFAQLDWFARPDLGVSGTVRHSHDRKHGTTGRRIGGLQAIPPVPEFELLRAMLLGQPADSRHQLRDESLDGALRLRYMPSRAAQYEVAVSSGYKPGGINGETVSGNVPPTFDAEHSRSIDASVALALTDAARMQLTVYLTEIRDYQALTYNPDSSPLIPQMNNIINVDRVRSRGVEASTDLTLPAGFRFATGVGYNDARYLDFRDAPCPPESGQLFCDLSGERMANAPRWTGFADLRHSIPLSDTRELYSGINYQYRSDYPGTTERGQGSHVDSRELVDALIGLRHPHWDIELWVRNLTDERYMSAVFALNGGGDYGALAGAPRTAGVSLVLRF